MVRGDGGGEGARLSADGVVGMCGLETVCGRPRGGRRTRGRQDAGRQPDGGRLACTGCWWGAGWMPRGSVPADAASLINVATLFALPVLAVPAILGGVAVDRGPRPRGLARRRRVRAARRRRRGAAAAGQADRRGGPTISGSTTRCCAAARRWSIGGRLTRERDTVRGTLGAQWGRRSCARRATSCSTTSRSWRRSSRPAPSARVAGAARLRRVRRVGHDPADARRPRVRRGGACHDAGAGRRARTARPRCATLAYRLVSYWLPIPAGRWRSRCYRRRAAHWGRAAPA